MTAKQTQLPAVNPLPDPPEHEPDDMTSVQQLGENGNLHHLVQHLSNPDTTIVSGERYIVPAPATPASQPANLPRHARLVQRQPGALPPRQRLDHLAAGQAARPGHGNSLKKNRWDRRQGLSSAHC